MTGSSVAATDLWSNSVRSKSNTSNFLPGCGGDRMGSDGILAMCFWSRSWFSCVSARSQSSVCVRPGVVHAHAHTHDRHIQGHYGRWWLSWSMADNDEEPTRVKVIVEIVQDLHSTSTLTADPLNQKQLPPVCRPVRRVRLAPYCPSS